MLTLLASLALSLNAQANPFAYLRHALRGSPVRMTIAPCETDFSCVEAGGVRYPMNAVLIPRDGYEIVGVSDLGQPRLLLVQARVLDQDELALVFADGGQIFGFHAGVNEAELPPVSPQSLAKVQTLEVRKVLTARTADQLHARAETLAKRVNQFSRAALRVTRDAIVADLTRIAEAEDLSPAAFLRVREALLAVQGGARPAAEPKLMRTHLEWLSRRVQDDLKTCGYRQDCSSSSGGR